MMHFVYTNTTKDADIPKTTLTHLRVDFSVTEIPAEAFQNCEALVHVQLPETLSRIGEAAFQYCLKLKFVQFVSNANRETSSFNHNLEEGLILFPGGGTLHVDDNAFSCCRGLRKVNVCSVSTKLGIFPFSRCHGLISVKLPEGLQVIEQGLFSGCTSLSTVNVPSSVIKISDFAFVGCRSLTSVDFPLGLLEIGMSCFNGCHSIETLEIPSTVTNIGKNAFASCIGLVYIKLPATLEILERTLFSGCVWLEYIEIPETVKIIADMAFHSCTSLFHVRIPPSVDYIGQCAFAECSSLISIELPEVVTLCEENRISDFSISKCSSLVNVAFPTLTGDLDVGEEDDLQNLKYDSVVDGFDDLFFKLKHRFSHHFPLHKLCYYQSYYSSEDAMAKLGSLMDDNPLAATTERDYFGMTPLHILSLSQTPNLNMLIAVINGGYLDQIIRDRDSFGSTPLDYLCKNKMPSSTQTIQSLLEGTIVQRLDWLGLDRWKSDVLEAIDEALDADFSPLLQAIDEAMVVDWSSRRRAIGVVYYKLAKYERKEILSMLDLFLWKVKIDKVCSKGDDQQSCRINSGASIVVHNVLPFLDKLAMEDYFDCEQDSIF